MNIKGFAVERIDELGVTCSSPLSFMYRLSPFVWRDGERYEILLRAVNHSPYPAEKIARVYYGHSDDGLSFSMGDHPVIAPGTGPDDKDGCEDPSVVLASGQIYVFYTGWNETAQRGQLLLAVGRDIEHLEKRGIALASSERHANPKEATVVAANDGSFRLFFEYAREGASQIGMASAPTPDGPWAVQPTLFEARPGGWDGWHLSTGPILLTDPMRPVMFYNGATADAKWRVGWIAFDEYYTRVIARGDDPVIVPPPVVSDDTDIAFAASAVEAGDSIFLYYSIADRDICRAVLHRA